MRSRHFGVFRDTDDILPTEEWRDRLKQLIEEADTVVFLLSPHSATSEVCAWEVDYAHSLNKRIAPIVIEDVEGDRIPPLLARLNFIFCTPRDPFENAVDTLISALNTDIDWIREHTRLSGLAKRWTDAGRPAHLLLRGQDIVDAETWRDSRPTDAPQISPVQAAFVGESRVAASHRQRNWVVGSMATVALTAALAVFAWFQSVEADRQRGVAEAEAKRAEANAEEAERQRVIAEDNADAAREQRDIAEQNAQEAERQKNIAEENARAEALARFQAEVRLADALSQSGTPEAWRTIRDAAQSYASSTSETQALNAMDGDVLRVALNALLKQRILKLEVPDTGAIDLVALTPGGERLITSHGAGLLIYDTATGKVSERFPDVGAAVYSWHIDDTHSGVISCSTRPCFSGMLSEEYETTDFLTQIYAQYVGIAVEDVTEDLLDQAFELTYEREMAVTSDIAQGRLSFLVLDAFGEVIVQSPLSICDDAICAGNETGPVAELKLGDVDPSDMQGSLDAERTVLPLMTINRSSGFAPFSDFLASNGLDPAEGPTADYVFSSDLAIRTSALIAEVEIFQKAEDQTWQRTTVCLEYDEEEEAECAVGFVGVDLLDASESAGLLLVTSDNQGTGGGAGDHHTSLIDLETRTVLWQVPRVSRAGAIAPDGSSFTVVDWLGQMEARNAKSFEVIYSHPEQIDLWFDEEHDKPRYAASAPIAAVTEASGEHILLDLTPLADLTFTAEPLPSQRGMCLETNDATFRTLMRQATRPFNAHDWAWIPLDIGVDDPTNFELPGPGEPVWSQTLAIDEGDILVVPDIQKFVEISNWADIQETTGIRFIESSEDVLDAPVWAALSRDTDMAVVWGMEERQGTLGVTWLLLEPDGEEWAVVASDHIADADSSGINPRVFAVSGNAFATYDGFCSLVVSQPGSRDTVWEGTMAFEQNGSVEIWPEEGVLLAVSHEWYDGTSLQLFDLATGAPGPWVIVTGDSWPGDEDVLLNVPPWGDGLRRRLLEDGGDAELE